MSWRYDNLDSVEKIKIIYKKFDEENEEGCFSKRFIYHLQEEFASLKKNGKLVVSPAIFEKELYRLLARAYNAPKNKQNLDKKKICQNFCLVLKELYEKMEEDFEGFINLLLIISFVKDEVSKVEKSKGNGE